MIEFHVLYLEVQVGFFYLMYSKSHYKRVKFSFWVSVVVYGISLVYIIFTVTIMLPLSNYAK